jgi:phenylalanyl-tRNA synthetase beta chain
VRVPFSWLREYCDPGLPVEEIAELLSMRAIEVERVGQVGAPSADGFVVGRVLAAEKHPNADRLSVCDVDTGDGTRTIVCGAPNVAAGQTVPVGLPGAVMPGGQKLGQAKLRGVVSHGMILSEAELEVGGDADGIIVLAEDGLAPGTPLEEVFPISEAVLELDLNPNRSDCFGVYGVAREVHAITGAPLAAPPWDDDAEPAGEGSAADYASVTVQVPELCPRFTARVLTDVRMGPSPLWMKARLSAAGQRPISNVVDVTNYVMLLTAQPLHAFDLDKVPDGQLIVRTARDGEKLTTLDGVERELDAETVLVCDRERPTGIAGIMGGQVSEVSDDTTRVLLEVANWNGVNILRTSGLLGLRSEASTRFEKQLHPELTIRAQRVASKLLVEMGATLVPETVDAVAEIPAPHVISLHGARTARILGIDVPRDEASGYLERLGFDVEEEGGEDLRATITPERHYDVSREIDLIEEVGRLHGFDRLPRTLPAQGDRTGGRTRDQRLRRRVEDSMSQFGFDETVTWGFVAPDLAARLRLAADDPRRATVALANPLSEDQSVMRTTLIGGLLDAARHNVARDAERVALFESGRAYLRRTAPGEGGPAAGSFPGRMAAPVYEPHRLCALVVGPLAPVGWRAEEREADFYAMKGVLEAVASRLDLELAFNPHAEPFLAPGRAAAIDVDGVPVGWLGELHPRVSAGWDLPGGVAFEVDLAPVFAAAMWGRERYEDVTSFPAVHEDIAVVVERSVPAAQVRSVVVDAAGELLRSARIFDVYEGEQVGEGHRSLALRLTYRAPDRTLTDAEVAERREAIKEALAGIGGSLRE